MDKSMGIRAGALSLVIFLFLLGIWHAATLPVEKAGGALTEYEQLMGKSAKKSDGMPTPAQMGQTIAKHLSDPFYDKGPNDKGIGIQLSFSLARVMGGFLLAAIVAIPLGFMIGMSPLLYRALDPFIQVLKPISPLAWMPLLLYSVKDPFWTAILVVFMASLWPTVANTAFGVNAIRKDYLHVAALLEMSYLRRLFAVVLPAAAPAIIAGLRISFGSALVAVVPAEMLLGELGAGYLTWIEWNNLDISGVIFAILVVGVVGYALDFAFGKLAALFTYTEV